MEIIPVIDLLDGLVVHARQGLRETYRPLQTPLCPSSEPLAVLKALRALYPFKTFYMADLNALMDKGSQHNLIQRILQTHPHLNFWIDQGLPKNSALDRALPNWTPVIGSESLDEAALPYLKTWERPFILSLDFIDRALIGPARLLENADYWPEKIIIMTLRRVGSHLGPDFQRLHAFLEKWPEKKFIAAGGVQNEQDLARLRALGIKAVLMASALHGGKIAPDRLRRYTQSDCNTD